MAVNRSDIACHLPFNACLCNKDDTAAGHGAFTFTTSSPLLVTSCAVMSLISHDLDVMSLISHDLGVMSLISHDLGVMSLVSHDLGVIISLIKPALSVMSITSL